MQFFINAPIFCASVDVRTVDKFWQLSKYYFKLIDVIYILNIISDILDHGFMEEMGALIFYGANIYIRYVLTLCIKWEFR